MRSIAKKIAITLLTLTISGCASTYYLDGKEYKDAKSFQQATDDLYASVLRSITPLAGPLTGKSLVFAFPSETAIYNETVRRHHEVKKTTPGAVALDQYKNLAQHSFKSARSFFNSIEKRGIYPDTTMIETNTVTNSIEPSSSHDVLYYTETSIGSGQYFYVSDKHGKQVFAYDRSGRTPEDRTKAFVDAVQALAARE